MIIGIDYGTKLSGHTIMAFYQDPVTPVQFRRAVPGEDADKKVLSVLKDVDTPAEVFLDAPLSLPNVYKEVPGFEDFFYRIADRDVKAMSPMFLGGLTARAMKIKTQLEALGFRVHEVYPSALSGELGLKELGYKKEQKNIRPVVARIVKEFPMKLNTQHVEDWHFVDALLCAATGIRYKTKKARKFGKPDEGLIWV